MSGENEAGVSCPVCWTRNDAARSTCELCGADLRKAPPSLLPLSAAASPSEAAPSAVVVHERDAGAQGAGHGRELYEGMVIRSTWRLVRFLGEGGAGSVWVAEHVGLGHLVAIKALVARYVRDATMKQRFLEEAVIQANVAHPNILRVADIVDEPAFSAIVMEYADGGSLEDWMEKRPDLGLRERLELFLGVLEGVGAAHSERIVHRDLKPANILIDTTAGKVTPKVTDFGIAKVLSEQKRTETGMAMGTVHYAAPEQLTDARSVDHRADIYALGCTLYELVTGRVPFERDSVFGMMRAHLEAPRPDASQSNPAVSRELARVIRRAMAIEPDRRYNTCAEFSVDVRGAIETLASPSVEASAAPRGNGSVDRGTALSGGMGKATRSLEEAAPIDARTRTPRGPMSGAERRSRTSPGPTPSGTRTRTPSLGPTASHTAARTRSGSRPVAPSGPRANGEKRDVPIVQGAILALALLILIGGAYSVLRPARGARGASDAWTNATVGPDGVVESDNGANGPGGNGPVASPPPAEDPVARVAAEDATRPPEAPSWTIVSCREVADRYLSFNLASEVPVSQAIDELDAASEPCRGVVAAHAAGEYERVTGLLVVDQIRYAYHQLRGLRDEAGGRDPCADVMMAASELQRGLRRLRDSIDGGFLLEYEVGSVSTRRDHFARLHQDHGRRWSGCTVPPLPPELDPRMDVVGAKPDGVPEESEQTAGWPSLDGRPVHPLE